MPEVAVQPPKTSSPQDGGSPTDGLLAGKAWWDLDGLHLAGPANERVSRKYLSPSSASSYRSCPARFAVEKLLPRPVDPFGAAELGTAAHAVLEELMGMEPGERTLVTAERLISEHLPVVAERVSGVVEVFSRLHKLGAAARTADAAHRIAASVPLSYTDNSDISDRVDKVLAALGDRPFRRSIVSQLASGLPGANEVTIPSPGDFTRWAGEVQGKLAGLWAIEDPAAAKVLHRELKFSFEIEGVPVLGFIDRVDSGGNGIPMVIDYKTGKVGKKEKHGDQLRLYCLAVARLTGVMPYRALAYYTAAGELAEVNTSRQAVNRTVETFKTAWAGIQSSQESATWPARPSPLCGWCPLALVCPSAKQAGRDAARSDIALIGPGLGVGNAPATAATTAIPTPDQGVHMRVDAPSMTTDPTRYANKEEAMTTTATTTDLRFGGEAQPWIPEANGGLNPNSYSATAVFSLVELAVESLDKAGQKITPSSVDALSATFAGIVTSAQHSLGATGSYQDGLHSRLRGALRTFLVFSPPPFGQPSAVWESWYQTMARRLVSTARAALRLWGLQLPETPWAPFVKEPEANAQQPVNGQAA